MAFGSRAIYCGELGRASVVKLVGNTLISFMLEGLCEGVTVARQAEVFQSARAQGWGKQDIVAVVKALEAAAGLATD